MKERAGIQSVEVGFALLDVLATEHPGVQRMRCHRCGAQRALPYRSDGASICGRCYRQTHLKVCVRCDERLGETAAEKQNIWQQEETTLHRYAP